ncbi:MAG: tetratricopeptide repeat protein [Pirellulales bacterium]
MGPLQCLAWAWLLLACSGCSFCGKLTPVPKDVLKCRQFAQQGLSAIDQGDDARGETLLAQAIKACPADVDARRSYSEVLWRRGAAAEAIQQMAEAAQNAPAATATDIRIRLAEMQLASGQNGAAYQSAQQAITSDVNQARAWTTRAKALRNAGDYRRALADCHRALALEPENQDLLLETAEIYRQLNQPQRALAQLQTLLETYPVGEEPQQPLVLAGLAYRAVGRNDEAATHLLAASQRGQPSPDLL